MARRLIVIISGAIVLVLILIAVGVFVIHSQANATNATATPTVTITATPAKRSNPYAKPLRQYGPDIKNQIAQGLKLTPDQLTSQLQSGKSLTDIATAQGLSTVDFQNLITNTLNNSLKPAVTSGELTQDQVAALIKRVQKNPKVLQNLLVSRPKTTPHPTGTATPSV